MPSFGQTFVQSWAINNLIDNGRESSILDFKEEWYKLEYRANQYEFIKDCISFLNVGMEVDKYIIIGIKENKVEGTFTIVGVNDRYEENNIQEIITENIEPIPQIDIITRVKIREYEIDIIKLRKENKDQATNWRNKCMKVNYDMKTYHVVGVDLRYWNTLKEFLLKNKRKVCVCVDIENAVAKVIEINDIDNIIKQVINGGKLISF